MSRRTDRKEKESYLDPFSSGQTPVVTLRRSHNLNQRGLRVGQDKGVQRGWGLFDRDGSFFGPEERLSQQYCDEESAVDCCC